MPRIAKTERTLTSQEQRLIRYYVREGGTEDCLPKAARKAKVKIEYARTMLKRTHVQAEIAARMSLLKFEQARLDAQDLNRRETEEDEHVRVAESKIYSELNKLLETPPEKLTTGHQLKAQILKFALVVTGTIRDGRTERLIPAEQTTGQFGPNIYQSVFEQRMTASDEEVADLYPDEPMPVAAGQPVSRSASQPVSKASDETASPAPAGSQHVYGPEIPVKRHK